MTLSPQLHQIVSAAMRHIGPRRGYDCDSRPIGRDVGYSQDSDPRMHRSRLHRPIFVGITGSCGKTTTKDLVKNLLIPTYAGIASEGNGNCGDYLNKTLLNVQPTHDFCIQELGAWGPDTLDMGIDLVQPDIGVVLNVRHDHFGSFKSLDNTQQEKSKLVRCLSTSGIAILNADDPRVWAMRHLTSAKVLSFGIHPNADLRFENVRAAWPDRLAFDLIFRGCRYPVETQLIGKHLIGSALAALSIALSIGIDVNTAIHRLAIVQPTARRMSPLVLSNGITFIRDDFKSTSDSLPELLDFLRQARAGRKIAVVGRISDHPGRSRRVYTPFAMNAAQVTDLLVLVGERPESLWGKHRGSANFLAELRSSRAQIELFGSVRDASVFLKNELRSGDLVLVKASGVADHMERVFLQYQTGVLCWRAKCGRTLPCDGCGELGSYADLHDTMPVRRSNDLKGGDVI
jgi:UDP-N-acetylmuramoyl-tripeptide--D-alanyl-D-alanine ligase